MSRDNPLKLLVFLSGTFLFFAFLTAWPGVLMIDGHEGDTLHMMDILLRMDAGAQPHRDFMTPIGILAFAPITLVMKLGFDIGQAFILGSVLVSLAILPMLWHALASRLGSGAMALLLGFYVIVLTMALVHGGVTPTIGISMYYNRWAWALSYIAILLAFLPPRTQARPVADGLVIGLCLSALVLIKVTYFIAFAPPIALALILRRAWSTAAAAVLLGLLVAGGVTALAGVDFWLAYIGDLLTVARSEVRPQPGAPFADILSAPKFIGATVLVLSAVMLLRKSDRMREGLYLLILAPGFFYVTYQNFGNDPQWLMLLAALLYSFRPDAAQRTARGWSYRFMMAIATAIALALTLPSAFNLTTSPIRHIAKDRSNYTPLLGLESPHRDILLRKSRVLPYMGKVVFDMPELDRALFGVGPQDEEKSEYRPARLMGEQLPACEMEAGLEIVIATTMREIEADPALRGKPLFTADIITGYWLYGRESPPLPGGAPWYYDGLPGIGAAELVVVPLCPLSLQAQREALEALSRRQDITLTEIRRTALYILLALRHTATGG